MEERRAMHRVQIRDGLGIVHTFHVVPQRTTCSLRTDGSCAVVEAGFRVLGKLEFLGELKFLSVNSKWAHE